ncbi:MAG: alpha-galactosidase [Aeromonas sp.]
MDHIITLRGKHSDLLLNLSSGAEMIHWGKKLMQPHSAQNKALVRAVPYGRLDVDVPLTLFPDAGRGVFSSPALEGHRAGQDWSPVFTLSDITHSDHALTLIAVDAVAQLTLTTELKLDANSDVLSVRHSLRNDSAAAFSVNRLACTLPLPNRAKECMSFYGRWVNEFQQQRHSLTHGGYQQENRRGRTGHEHFPALVMGSQAFSEQQGEVWGAHFAWSGNHRLRVDVKADGRRFLQAEVIYYAGEISLGQGESLTTPWLYATYSDSGLNGMSQQFHQFVREQILRFPARKSGQTLRPVHLNTWEGIYFDHDPAYIMQMASEAAAMGVERFIIDDGWFKGRNNDKAALGDWYLDTQKYPNGLQPVIDHVLAQGMEFGIWVEPEMINKDSDLYRAHPDWLLQLPAYDQPMGRNQYVLDLQNPDVFAYLLERLDALLRDHPAISYLKWDMNREVVQPAHLGRAAQHAQIHNVYRLMDELKAKHPQVEIESCAAGGGRIDYEVLKRVQRFWPSDNNDALNRQDIQRGFSYFFPPEVMGSHIGSRHCHATRRVSDIHFRGITALFGHMGIELDPVKESSEEKAGFAKYIALHKQYRDLLHSGTTYRLDADEPSHMIHAVVSQDQQQALIMVAMVDMQTYALAGNLRVPGLSPDRHYHAKLVAAPDNLHNGLVSTQPAWMLEEIELSGEWLAEVGVAMPVLDPTTAILIELTAI